MERDRASMQIDLESENDDDDEDEVIFLKTLLFSYPAKFQLCKSWPNILIAYYGQMMNNTNWQ